ncbi:MAG: hypothetical protein ACK5M3_04920 [Dysgonomonas sp.]
MKTNFGNSILLLLLMSILSLGVKAQVTIGSGIEPKGGALLDLQEYPVQGDNETANKGLLYPRVKLTDTDELYPMYTATDPDYTANRPALKQSHIGLIVFNVTSNTTFTPGLYFWNGTNWRRSDDSPAVKAEITDLLCNNVTMSPSSYTSGTPFDAIVKIPYLGGTGGTYDGTAPSAAVNGLRIERIAGKLNYGGGEVMYRVSGTPTISSPNTTTFPITFLTETCSISIGSGVSSVNLKNLTSDVTVSTAYVAGREDTANQLPFGTIKITESGSYAFSLRLYGRVSQDGAGRWPFYIYLQKNGKTTVLDAAEIDLVTVQLGHEYRDYSYSVTLGGVYEVGDEVIISMHKPASGPTWTLRKGSSSNSPVRTSLIYWKL